MRGIFIAVGAAAINEFSWVFYLFGLFLVYTAAKLAKDDDRTTPSTRRPRLVRGPQRGCRHRDEWNGVKLFIQENGKRLVTPMFIVMSRSAPPTCCSRSTRSRRSTASPASPTSC